MHSYTVSTIQRPKKLQNYSQLHCIKSVLKITQKSKSLICVKLKYLKVWKYDIVIYYIGL